MLNSSQPGSLIEASALSLAKAMYLLKSAATISKSAAMT